jgi:hypothetical protein
MMTSLTEWSSGWFKGAKIRWDNTDAAAMGMMIQNVLNMSDAELAQSGDIIKQIYEVLEKAIANGDQYTA